MFALRNCPGCEPQASFVFVVINFKLLFCVHCLIRGGPNLLQLLKSLLGPDLSFGPEVLKSLCNFFADHNLSTSLTVSDVILKQVSKSYSNY